MCGNVDEAMVRELRETGQALAREKRALERERTILLHRLQALTVGRRTPSGV